MKKFLITCDKCGHSKILNDKDLDTSNVKEIVIFHQNLYQHVYTVIYKDTENLD